MQRRYVRRLVSEIVVDHEKVIISGPKAAIAAAITASAIKSEVPSIVRKWLAVTWPLKLRGGIFPPRDSNPEMRCRLVDRHHALCLMTHRPTKSCGSVIERARFIYLLPAFDGSFEALGVLSDAR